MRNNPTNGNWIYDSSNVQALPPPFPPNHRPSIQVTLLLALNYHPHYYYVSFRAGCFLFFLVSFSLFRVRESDREKQKRNARAKTASALKQNYLHDYHFLHCYGLRVFLIRRPSSWLPFWHGQEPFLRFFFFILHQMIILIIIFPLFSSFPFLFLFKLSGFQLLEFRIIWFNRLCSLLLLSEERGENEEEQVEEEEDFAVSFLVC